MSIELMERKKVMETARRETHALRLAGETGGRTWLDAKYDETLAELYYLSANRMPGLTAIVVMMLALAGIAFLIAWSLVLPG